MASAKPDLAYLYLMGLEGGGPSKIGYAVCPAKRLKQLQAYQKGKMLILGEWAVAGRLAMNVERYVHWLFRERHYKGEWFNVSLTEMEEAVQRALDAPLETCGLIPSVAPPGRQPWFPEHLAMRFAEGTIAAIDEAKGDDEARTDFVRTAVEAELKRRERKPKTGAGE